MPCSARKTHKIETCCNDEMILVEYSVDTDNIEQVAVYECRICGKIMKYEYGKLTEYYERTGKELE